MRLRRHVVVPILVVVSILVSLTAGLPAAAATGLPSARVWVTTPDGAMKLSDRGAVDFRPGGSDALTISVGPTRRYQAIDGFGASITDSSAYVLSRLDGKTRAAAMRRLFSRTDGDGLSFLRQPMGASDFVAGGFYTYDDITAGRTDYEMTRFSIAHDRARILPLLRQALTLNPQLEVIGSPWSAPAWMKTNQSLIGGRLIDEPRIYAAYARYFVEFVRAYERAGVPIYAVTMQNEPQNRHPNGYPGMDMPVAQEAKLIEALGPALHAAGLRTKILGYDHNWSEHPNDIASTPPGEDPETEYPSDLLSSSAGRWIAGTAFHCYSGDPSRQTGLHDAFPDKGIWFTECSGSHGPNDPPAQIFSDTLKWHARNLVLGVTRNWARTVVNWNLALDPAGGPHLGGCDSCSGVVTVGPGQTVTPDRQHVVRDDRVERPDHGRRLPQPRRLDRAGGAQRERRSAQLRRRPGRRVVRLHAARRRARHVHLAGLPGAQRRPRPAGRARDYRDRFPSGRRGERRRRRRHDALDDGRRTGAGPVPPGGPGPLAARAPRRPRHGRRRG